MVEGLLLSVRAVQEASEKDTVVQSAGMVEPIMYFMLVFAAAFAMGQFSANVNVSLGVEFMRPLAMGIYSPATIASMLAEAPSLQMLPAFCSISTVYSPMGRQTVCCAGLEAS